MDRGINLKACLWEEFHKIYEQQWKVVKFIGESWNLIPEILPVHLLKFWIHSFSNVFYQCMWALCLHVSGIVVDSEVSCGVWIGSRAFMRFVGFGCVDEDVLVSASVPFFCFVEEFLSSFLCVCVCVRFRALNIFWCCEA